MTYQDEVWSALPQDRLLDETAFRFALAAVRGAKRVLDVGCGDGLLTARLAESGAAVTGVDPSTVALEHARRKHPELEFALPGEDGALPFRDASFDVVTCVNVLQHVVDTQRLLSEIRRVLSPGGTLAAVVPWYGRLKNVLIALGAFERHYDPLEPVVRFYTPRSLRALLEQFGFDAIVVRGAGGVPLLRASLLATARRTPLAPA